MDNVERRNETENSGRDEIDAWIDSEIEQTKKCIAVCDEGKARPIKEPAGKLSLIQADELQRMELEPVKFIVDDIIVTGMTIIASEPKFGKSWLMLDMCIRVAAGENFLGHKTHQCKVLYLALEDSYNRLQSRMNRILNGREAPSNLSLAIQSADLEGGLLEQMGTFCEENPDTGLIIIDTFQRVRSASGRNESVYGADYREVGQLKQFADEHKLAIVLVHHTRKMKDPSDIFMNISGSMGITGAADTMIVLSKEQRTDKTTKMSITGRDVEMQEYEMEFRKENCRWHILGTSDEVEEQRAREQYDKNPVVLTVKKLMGQNNGSWKGTAKELIAYSQYLGTPIFDNSRKVGKSLEKLSEDMYQYDKIIYEKKTNGTGGGTHMFRYLDKRTANQIAPS